VNDPVTNMVFLSLKQDVECDAEEVAKKLQAYDILVGADGRQFRLVTHFWIDDAGVEKTIAAFCAVL
jgi:threonine aldolase